MDLTQIKEMLAQFTGIERDLFGVAIMFAVMLRFARAYFVWCDDPHTFAVALAMGVAGAITGVQAHQGWQFIMIQSFALTTGVMIVEWILRTAPEKVPFLAWLPKDNGYVSSKKLAEAEHTAATAAAAKVVEAVEAEVEAKNDIKNEGGK